MTITPASALAMVLTAAWLLLGAWSACHAVMYKREPRSAGIWVLLSFTLPLLGPWIYWVFGINRIERRVVRRLGRRERPFDPSPVTNVDVESLEQACIVGPMRGIYRVAQRVTRLPLLPGNEITSLHGGEQAYPEMLEAIRSAERSVTLESYIFDWDDIGRSFVDALDDAAQRGVSVHVLVDGVGALGSFSRMGRLLLASGAEVASFFPLRFPLGRLRINLRNHRKVLVVDGHTGFTGGMNISQRHVAGEAIPARAEDLHFKLRGPIVAELQHTFVEGWRVATRKLLSGERYFPTLEQVGHVLCRGVVSGPDEDFESIHIIIRAALAAAQEQAYLVTPYFVPTPSLISAMTIAGMRGVDVKLILPGTLDLPYVKWATDSYLWQLLEHGIEVYRMPPPFRHTKLMVVDDRWTFIGSANLDRRSFRLNFEFNVEAYDAAFATRMREVAETLLVGAERVTLEQMDSRPKWRRLRDGTAMLFSQYL